MADINGIPYVESDDLVSAYPTVSQALAQEVSDQLASKLPYSFGTATPTTTDSGFLWYDSNSTPAAPKFWDGAAFQAIGGGTILQIVRATDSTDRSTTSTSYTDVTGMSVTITPNKSDSAVLLIASVLMHSLRTSGPTTAGYIQITDSSNNAISGTADARQQVGGDGFTSVGIYNPTVVIGYSTPATTSATTFKLRFKAGYASAMTLSLKNSEMTGQMYAIEVSA
jgi:hypothetical protein